MADVHAVLFQKPLYLQAPGTDPTILYSAEEFRRHDAAMYPRAGVLSPLSFKVTQSDVVGWSVKVNSGWAALGGTFEKYIVTSEATTTLDLSGFNTSPSATRTHRVWLCVYDDSYVGTLTGQAQIVATEDVNGTGALAPPDARFALLLANVLISPGQANIQNANISTGYSVRGLGYSGFTQVGAAGLPLSVGIVDAASDTHTAPVNVSVRNGMAYLSGAVTRSSSSFFVQDTTYGIGVLPVDYAPLTFKAFALAGGPNAITGSGAINDYMYRLVITNDRQVFAYIPTGYTTNYLYLDGAYWALDL